MTIVFDTVGMIEQVKNNPCSEVEKEICSSHIISVWEAICCHVIKKLCQGIGLRINGLCKFTFKVLKTELSPRAVMIHKIPHILINAELAYRHALPLNRPNYNIETPEDELNLSVIAQTTGISRAHVQLCLDEIISAYNRALACDSEVHLWFPKIGRMIVQSGNVSSVFIKDFLDTLGYAQEYVQDKACPVR